jgi:threonine/homoserine efflux transporter RhtA
MRTAAVMLGESLREAGVLVVVFHGVSVLIPQGKSVGAVEIAGAVISVVSGVLLWWYGAILELEG